MTSLCAWETRLFDGFDPPRNGKHLSLVTKDAFLHQLIRARHDQDSSRSYLHICALFVSAMNNFVCQYCVFNANHSKIRWLKHTKGLHNPSFEQLLDQRRDHFHEVNLLHRAMNSIDENEEVRLPFHNHTRDASVSDRRGRDNEFRHSIEHRFHLS